MEESLSSGSRRPISHRKLDTKGCCFLCLTVTELKSELDSDNTSIATAALPNNETVNLKQLQSYLQLYNEKISGSSKVNSSGSCSSNGDFTAVPTEWSRGRTGADYEADLCQSCGRIFNNFSKLFSSLEKIHIEIDYWLKRMHQQISETFDKKPELVQNYSKRMTASGDSEALAQLVFVDSLRMEIAKKSAAEKNLVQPKVHLRHLKKTEIENYLGKGKRHLPEQFQSEQPVDAAELNRNVTVGIPSFAFTKDNINGEQRPTNSSTASTINQKHKRQKCSKCGSFFYSNANYRRHFLKCDDGRKRPPKAKSGSNTPSKIESNTKAKKEVELEENCSVPIIKEDEEQNNENYAEAKIKYDQSQDDDDFSLNQADPFIPTEAVSSQSSSCVDDENIITEQVQISQPKMEPCHNKNFKRSQKNKCVKCGKFQYSKRRLEAHMRKCDGTTKPQSGTFSFFDAKTRNYNCRMCKKAFTTSSNANAHYHVAHLRTEYKCEGCKVILRYRSSLISHKKICKSIIESKLAKDEPDPRLKYTCPSCGKGFAQKGNMEIHQKAVHLKEKNFACEFCEEKFCYYNALKDHKDLMHFGVLYECKFCKKSFPRRRCAHIHEKRCRNSVKYKKQNQSSV